MTEKPVVNEKLLKEMESRKSIFIMGYLMGVKACQKSLENVVLATEKDFKNLQSEKS